jgi:hypothetical protein
MRIESAKMWTAVLPAATAVCTAAAGQTAVVLDRDGSTVVLEAYAPNIVRVTLSTIRNSAMSVPGDPSLPHPMPDREGTHG